MGRLGKNQQAELDERREAEAEHQNKRQQMEAERQRLAAENLGMEVEHRQLQEENAREARSWWSSATN